MDFEGIATKIAESIGGVITLQLITIGAMIDKGMIDKDYMIKTINSQIDEMRQSKTSNTDSAILPLKSAIEWLELVHGKEKK